MFEESKTKSMEETWEIGTGRHKTLSTSKDFKPGRKNDSKEETEADFDDGFSEVGRKIFIALTGAKEESVSK